MQVGSSVVTQTIDGKPVKVVKINPELKHSIIVNKSVNNNNNTRKPQPIYSSAQRNECSKIIFLYSLGLKIHGIQPKYRHILSMI